MAERNASTVDEAAQRAILLAELRESFGRVVYTHKTHEKSAENERRADYRIKVVQIGLSAVTTSAIVGAIAGTGKLLTIASAIVSALSTGFTLYTRQLNHGALAQRHKDTAIELLVARDRYISLIGDLSSGVMSITDGRKLRDRLREEAAAAYKRAPQTSGAAFGAASTALKKNEEMTFSNAEIDAFLPGALRIGGGSKSTELPKAELSKAELPKAELPKAELPKAELPKAELPKAELPKTELPKTEPAPESDSGR